MLTRMAPALAVAYWRITHSALLGDQMPTRSPGSTPEGQQPAGHLVDGGASWA